MSNPYPTFSATPVKPMRQMSQHASQRNQNATQQHDPAGYPQAPSSYPYEAWQPSSNEHAARQYAAPPQHSSSSPGPVAHNPFEGDPYGRPPFHQQQQHQNSAPPVQGPYGMGTDGFGSGAGGPHPSHSYADIPPHSTPPAGDMGFGYSIPRTQSPQTWSEHAGPPSTGYFHDERNTPTPRNMPGGAPGTPGAASSYDLHNAPYGHQGQYANSQTNLVGGPYHDGGPAYPPYGGPGGAGTPGYESIEMQQDHYAPSPFVPPGAPGMPPQQQPSPYGFSGPGPLHMPNPQDPTADASQWLLATPGTMIATGAGGDMRYRAQGGAGYGETRERLMRKRTVKHIELTNGNLVLEVPVPTSISKSGQGHEFTRMRYQAVTCDPNDFVRENYALRPWLYGRAPTELMICMTMYNEDKELFCKTMNGVIKNIAHLTSRGKSKTWGADAWKKVVVVVVSDGRKKANADTLKILGLMGCYNEAVMLDHVGERPTTAHVFEYTSQVVVQPDGTVQVGACPVQIILCLKEQNQKKLNSHRWFFNAFCQQLQPNVCILLDVGTKPSGTSLYDLWKAFDKHPKCGGACGEIRVDAGKAQWQLINPLVASQNFEYKISNILDKPLESVFGYISVLPGAFSAYRYKAVQGAPLESYFKGEALHSGAPGMSAGTFASNMYLAEDRILCFELVTKKNQSWTLRYIKSAHAATDVPQQVPEFIAQRRRWLNGSFFASIYATVHWYRIWTSGQGFLRKLILTLQALYNLAQLVFTWTAIANFFLAFYFLISSATSDPTHDPFGGQGTAILEVIQNVLIALMVICLVCSLGNRPQGSKFAYTGVMVIFALIMCLGLYCAGWTTYLALDAAGLTHLSGWTVSNIGTLFTTSGFRDIVISLAATYVLWFVASILFLDPWHMITSFWGYLLLIPSYTIVLAIYSMSNLHDVSWGTKGSDKVNTDLGKAAKTTKDGKEVVQVKVPTTSDEAEDLWGSMQRELATPQVKDDKPKRSVDQKQADDMSNFRTTFLLAWIITNAVLIIVFTSSWFNAYIRKQHKASGAKGPVINPYQTAVFYSMAGFAAIRALGALLYLIFFRILGW